MPDVPTTGIAVEDGAAPTRSDRERPRPGALVLVGLAVLPLLAVAVHLWSSDYHPAGDLAVIELRVRDVGAHTPLLGPYSRYGWSHPGPLIYVLLAVPYRLLGAGSSAILSASAVFNGAAVAAMGLLAWRRGRLALVAITSVPLLVFVHFMTPTLLADPWNPYLTVLPVGLLVLLAWSVIERDRWCLPALVLVGSFLAQSHVGYLPLVGAVGGAVLAWAAVARWRARRRASGCDGEAPPPWIPPRWRRPALVALALGVVAWIPVLVDQLAGTGNLRDIADYFLTSDRTPYGVGPAIGLVAREWGNRAPWLGGIEPVLPDGGAVGPREVGALLLPLAASMLGAVAAYAGRAWSALRLQAIVALTALVTVVSVARITDVVYDYLVRWTWIVGTLIWISALWSLWSGLAVVVRAASDRRHPRAGASAATARPRRLATVGRVAVPVLVVVLVVAVADRSWATVDLPMVLPEIGSQAPLEAMTPQVVAGVPAHGTLWIRAEGGYNNATGDGLTLALERAGHPVALHPVERYKFGPSRTTDVTDAPVATVSYVYGDNVAEWDRRDGVTNIARWDPLTPDERDEFTSLSALLHDQFEALGRDDLVHQLETHDSAYAAFSIPEVDRGALERWEELRRRGQLVAVFLGPPPS